MQYVYQGSYISKFCELFKCFYIGGDIKKFVCALFQSAVQRTHLAKDTSLINNLQHASRMSSEMAETVER